MTTHCPQGHATEHPERCEECAATPLASGADPNAPSSESRPGRAADDIVQLTSVAQALTGRCSNCGSLTDTSSACSQCGYQFEVVDTEPVWEEERWEIVARPDRTYYEQLEADGMEFPETVQSRRIPLVGDYVRIGRRSASRGITPEIDLAGPWEDTGVSHRHAVLMRQPGGDWALVDQGSANGTFLNGELEPIPADQPVPLRDGDQIHVGAFTTLAVERSTTNDVRTEQEDGPSRDTRTVARGRLGLDLRLLGPLELLVAGEMAPLGAPKIRAVLATLALRIGASVSSGDLEWALWGEREPPTAAKALQGYISTLRRTLPAGAIETTAGGYRLLGPKDVVDVFRFERRSAHGRVLLESGHPGSAVAELGRALTLWRGDPLPDLIDGPTGSTEVSRLLRAQSHCGGGPHGGAPVARRPSRRHLRSACRGGSGTPPSASVGTAHAGPLPLRPAGRSPPGLPRAPGPSGRGARRRARSRPRRSRAGDRSRCARASVDTPASAREFIEPVAAVHRVDRSCAERRPGTLRNPIVPSTVETEPPFRRLGSGAPHRGPVRSNPHSPSVWSRLHRALTEP